MTARMSGVVLWSGSREQSAVIWCEDHGDLAYYTADDHGPATRHSLSPGALICFDLCDGLGYRRARNLQIMEIDHDPNLPERIRARTAPTAPRPAQEATVLPFITC